MKITTCSASLFLACCVSSTIANAVPVVLTSDASGTKWVSVRSNSFTDDGAELLKLTQKENTLIAAMRNFYGLPMVAKSVDKGATWTTAFIQTTTFIPLGVSANDKGIIIGGNSQYGNPYVNNSVDGDGWQGSSISFSYDCENLQKLTGFAANSSTMLLSGLCQYLNNSTGQTYSRATLLTSSDGASRSWQVVNTLPQELQTDGAAINFVQWIKDKWFVLATTSTNQLVILTSVDMNAWTMMTVPHEVKALTSIAANGDEYVAIGKLNTAESVIMHSIDQGKNWTLKTFSKDQTFNQIRYSGSWIIVGKSGEKETRLLMLISKDGITWANADLPIKVTNPSTISTLNDVIWTGEKWIAIGAYDSSKSGCVGLRNLKWTGKLQAAQSIISVTNFNAWSDGKTKDNVTYDGNAAIEYTGSEGGQFGFGVFDGTCVESADEQTMNLSLVFKGRSINAIFNAADKAMKITSSCLPDEHSNCMNFTGTLSGN